MPTRHQQKGLPPAKGTTRRARWSHRRIRFASYGAVGLIAAVLITLSLVLGGGQSTPQDHLADGAPSLGSTTPDFALTDVVSGTTVTADSLRGRRALLFFSEGVSCQACMVQAADLEKNDDLKRAGIDLVSVTTDDPGDLAEAGREYGIDTPLLADPSTEMSRAYGMLGRGGMGHPDTNGHAFMLLDEEGVVLWQQAYQEMYVETDRLLADMKAQVYA